MTDDRPPLTWGQLDDLASAVNHGDTLARSELLALIEQARAGVRPAEPDGVLLNPFGWDAEEVPVPLPAEWLVGIDAALDEGRAITGDVLAALVATARAVVEGVHPGALVAATDQVRAIVENVTVLVAEHYRDLLSKGIPPKVAGRMVHALYVATMTATPDVAPDGEQ